MHLTRATTNIFLTHHKDVPSHSGQPVSLAPYPLSRQDAPSVRVFVVQALLNHKLHKVNLQKICMRQTYTNKSRMPTFLNTDTHLQIARALEHDVQNFGTSHFQAYRLVDFKKWHLSPDDEFGSTPVNRVKGQWLWSAFSALESV